MAASRPAMTYWYRKAAAEEECPIRTISSRVLAPAATRQGGRGVAEVMEAQPLHAGGAGGWDPDPAGEVAAPDRTAPLGREHQPLRAGLGLDA
jgi:hypothetical protein